MAKCCPYQQAAKAASSRLCGQWSRERQPSEVQEPAPKDVEIHSRMNCGQTNCSIMQLGWHLQARDTMSIDSVNDLSSARHLVVGFEIMWRQVHA